MNEQDRFAKLALTYLKAVCIANNNYPHFLCDMGNSNNATAQAMSRFLSDYIEHGIEWLESNAKKLNEIQKA